MDKDKLLESFKIDVRSILLSAPCGVPKVSFRRDYKELIGSEPPLGRLGYSSIEEFVSRNSDVATLKIGPTGEPTLFVVGTEETKHVLSLVSRQKKPDLKKLRKAISKPRPIGRASTFAPPPRRTMRPVRRQPMEKMVPDSYRAHSRPPIHSRTPWAKAIGGVVTQSVNTPPLGNRDLRTHLNEMKIGSRNQSGIPPYSSKYDNVPSFGSVSQLISSKGRHNDQIVVVTGYPGRHENIQQYPGEFRVLLFDRYYRNRLERPFLNVFFTNKYWNVKVYSDPLTLPNEGGVKIKILGILVYKFWDTIKEYRHSLKALYYQRIETAPPSSFVGMSLRVTSSLKGSREVYSAMPPLTSSQTNSLPSHATGHSFHNTSKSASSSSSFSSSSSSITSAKTPPSLEVWLKEVLADKPNGLWAKVIINMYNKTFKEDMDMDNFLKQISSFPFIRTECIVEDNPILYLNKEEEEEKEEEIPSIPDIVQLPDDKLIDVLVVSIKSFLHFYVQYISNETTEKLQKLEDSLEKYFQENKHSPPTKLDPNRLYATCWEEGTWCRTKLVLETGQTTISDKQESVHVFYPDYGNEESIERSKLRVLPAAFYDLPFQAVLCTLDGLQKEQETQEGNDEFEEAAFEMNCLCNVKSKSGDFYSVELSCDDLNINNLIEDVLYPIESLHPSLPSVESGDIVSVVLRDIGIVVPGLVIVHVEGRGTEKLEELNSLINDHCEKDVEGDDEPFKPLVGVVCCAQYSDEWYRVKVLSIEGDKISVLFIDYGNIQIFDKEEELKAPLSHPLFQLPGQAIMAQMHGLPPPQCEWSDKATNWLYEYVDTRLSLKMVTPTECILYHEESNLNEKMLQLESDLFPPKYSLLVDDYPTVTLPVDEAVYVAISHCVSPNEFTVQIASNLKDLESLQGYLQEYSTSAPPLSQLQTGLLCSVQSTDGMWYRGVLMDTVTLREDQEGLIEEVPVRYLDYGDEEKIIISGGNLKQLNKELLTLPFQAVPVKLHGVVPIQGTEWDTSACDKFQELVLDNYFFCQLKEVCPNGRSLVSLLNHKTSQLISSILISEKLAS